MTKRKITEEDLKRLQEYMAQLGQKSGQQQRARKASFKPKQPTKQNLLDEFDNLKKQGVSGLKMDQQNQAKKLLAQLGIRTGIGKLGGVTSLFFGLTTGQMSWEGFQGNAWDHIESVAPKLRRWRYKETIGYVDKITNMVGK